MATPDGPQTPDFDSQSPNAYDSGERPLKRRRDTDASGGLVSAKIIVESKQLPIKVDSNYPFFAAASEFASQGD